MKEQPDLNWRNPEVRHAMLGAGRFWLDRGIDGFRVDVLWLLIKDDQFRDNPPNPAWQPHQPGIERLLQQYTADRPEMHELVGEMRAVLDGYPDRVLIGEIYLPLERLVTYYGENRRGAQLPFNFQLISAAWTAQDIGRIVDDYEAALPEGCWPNWVLGNHDQKRIATRVGVPAAPLAAMLLLTLRGTPTLYYGDELALENVAVPPDRTRDPWVKTEPRHGFGRDPERTPMPWDDSENAGFTAGSPWLPLNSDHAVRNVTALAADTRSILSLYRRLIALRRRHSALCTGRYVAIRTTGDVFVFERCDTDSRLVVMLNFADVTRRAALPADTTSARILLSTCLDREGEQTTGELTFRAGEGVVLEVPPP